MKKRETLTTKKMSKLLIGLLLMTVVNVFTAQKSIVAQTMENPGFETGDLNGWVLSKETKTEINQEIVYEGTYSCLIKGPQSIKTTVTGLTENTTYDVSIMHRLEEVGDGDRASSLFCLDANDDTLEIAKEDATIEYQKLSVQFTTGSGQTSIVIGVENNDFYWAYFDDLIVVEAGAIDEYTLTITAENGSVTPDPDQVSYASGTEVSLTATPDEGYEFSDWSGDVTSTDNPLSVTMDASKSVTATFTEIISNEIVIENPGFETGDLTGWELSNTNKTSINDSLGVVSEGMYSCLLKGPNSVQTTVTGLAENTSYYVSIAHRLAEIGEEDRTQSLYYIDGNGDPVIAATQIGDTVYQQLSYRLTTTTGQTSIEIGVQNDGFFWGYYDDLTVVEPIDVTGVTLDKESASVEVSNTIQLAATVTPEDATDQSVTWSTDDASIATVDENGLVTGVSEGVTSITATTNDQGLTASCEITVTAAPTSILTLSIVGNGSVMVDGVEYTEPVTVSLDQVVSISATADDGNEFTEWSGDASGTDNPLSITMDADKSITANFDVLQSIDVPGINATIYPNPVDNSLYIESKSAIQKITLVNSIGVKVETFTLTGEYSVNLPVSNLKSGLYILILEDITGNESFEKVFKK